MDARGNNGPLIAAGGGVLLFISLFITWAFEASAWETFDFVDVILALIALIAIAVGAMLATGNTANLPSSPGTIVTMSGVVSLSIVAAFIIEFEERGFGIFLGLIGAIAMLVGGVQLANAGAAPGARPRTTEPPPPPPSSGPSA